MKPIIRITLIILNVFLAITSITGGLGLITGFATPPLKILNGSIFQHFLLPGLALSLLIGSSATIASILLILNHKFALRFSLIAAFTIIIFEIVEVSVIGSPEGIARNLQLIYLLIGIVIGVLSLILKRLVFHSNS